MSLLPFELFSGLLLLGSLVLFRLFDIVKPWPVDVAERGLPGAWGVVLDDVVAGLLTGGCMTLICIVMAAN
jgi:phosphatidylglycerophosphatase A